MFFGSFSVKGLPFIDNTGYLNNELNKNLTCRVLIEADEVYPIGATERECLDSLDDIERPYDLCLSLIYRKLKGNRGCTMITEKEYQYIMEKIKRNNSKPLKNEDSFSYVDGEIHSINEKFLYSGEKFALKMFDRLCLKKENGNAYESHLQAYLLQNLDQITPLHVCSQSITWIGNEMSCGVGMQSIDVVFMQKEKNDIHIVICELKDEQPVEYIKTQLYKYVEWISQYIVPTLKVFISSNVILCIAYLVGLI